MFVTPIIIKNRVYHLYQTIRRFNEQSVKKQGKNVFVVVETFFPSDSRDSIDDTILSICFSMREARNVVKNSQKRCDNWGYSKFYIRKFIF